MKPLPPFDPSSYDQQIEQVFDRLERRIPRGRQTTTLRADLTKARHRLISLSIISGACSIVVAGYTYSLGTSVMPTKAMIVGAALSTAAACFYTAAKFGNKKNFTGLVDSCLGLVGRSLPISKSQAQIIANFSQKHPRIVEILGRWQAANPDNTLNLSNFRTLMASVREVEQIKEDRAEAHRQHIREQERRQAVQQTLRETGIASVASKVRLEGVATQDDPNRLDRPAPKRAL